MPGNTESEERMSRRTGSDPRGSSRGADRFVPESDLGDYCAPGATAVDQIVELSTGVSLRVVTITPAEESRRLPVVLMTGLVSVMRTFRNIIRELSNEHQVYYVETREKSSSVVPDRADFSVEAMGLDTVDVIHRLGLKENGYIFIGASLAATAAIHCHDQFREHPRAMIFLEPNAMFVYPRWSLSIIRYAAPFYRFVRPVAQWYLQTFRINAKEDQEMLQINRRALSAADPYKLRDTVLAICDYEVWDHLEAVRTPVMIVYASKDKFHVHDDIMRMISMMDTATPHDLETHERIHSPEFVNAMQEYIDTL
jgi:pimeloyl-ACP methyl ester carboxylesterase